MPGGGLSQWRPSGSETRVFGLELARLSTILLRLSDAIDLDDEEAIRSTSYEMIAALRAIGGVAGAPVEQVEKLAKMVAAVFSRTSVGVC